jgi:glycosyltransferase involved in cell wall biosynthesis
MELAPAPIHPDAMRGGRPLRVLHCPWNVAGNTGVLSRAQRALGVDSRLISLRPNAYGYLADEILAGPDASPAAAEAARLRLFWRAIRWADVVHFNFGQSCFMPETAPDVAAGFRHSIGRGFWHAYAHLIFMRDLPLLCALGKRIAVTFQGDDARQSRNAQRFFEWGLGRDQYSDRTDRWKRRVVNNFGRYADAIYTVNADLLPLLPERARFVPYTVVEPDETLYVGVPGNRIPVIAHAPSDRGIIELDLIENLPNQEARERYKRADLIVDQLVMGWYGGFAVEAMAIGKPVVVHMQDEDLRGRLPDGMFADIPVIRADPGTIADVLREWLGPRRAELPEIGARSRRYVERWHDPKSVAQTMVGDYARMLGRVT